MVSRLEQLSRVRTALRRSPVTAILGPRQCGKTTLALQISRHDDATFFDLESQADLTRLQNPELILSALTGLVIIDEIQRMPELFDVLRVVVDRGSARARFLILGSASPQVVKSVSESLAGRVEFVELSGFSLSETGAASAMLLWTRGGFPRSFLADSDEDSFAWRDGFLRTFLERDIPQFGISIPHAAMRRFWTMVAHYHGQIWNASEFGRSMGLTDKTARAYLDVLTGTYMVRQLQPWHENLGKRQVKSPKTYLRDTGLLHSLLGLPDQHSLNGYPRVGASWEGFVIEQAIDRLAPIEPYFWASHQGAELDLFFTWRGERFGVEVKFSEAPRITRSMRVALQDLKLRQLWIVYPGAKGYVADNKISVIPIDAVQHLPKTIDALVTA